MRITDVSGAEAVVFDFAAFATDTGEYMNRRR